jgi:hypothetical protein
VTDEDEVGQSVPSAWRAARWGMGDAVGGVALSLVLSIAVSSAVIAVFGLDAFEFDHLALWATVLLQVPLWGSLLGVTVWACRTKGSGSLRADFGLWMRRSDVVVGLASGLVAQIGLLIVLVPIYRVLGVDPDDVGKTANDLADRAPDAFAWVCLFVLVVAAAPFFEELFYRGLLLRAIRKRYGDAVAVVGSGVIFGAIHFEPVATLALALFGMVLAWLAVRTGRLGPSIWAHVAFNLTTFIGLVLSR